ncbi:unnamed protein product [Calypogeia fissa]
MDSALSHRGRCQQRKLVNCGQAPREASMSFPSGVFYSFNPDGIWRGHELTARFDSETDLLGPMQRVRLFGPNRYSRSYNTARIRGEIKPRQYWLYVSSSCPLNLSFSPSLLLPPTGHIRDSEPLERARST